MAQLLPPYSNLLEQVLQSDKQVDLCYQYEAVSFQTLLRFPHVPLPSFESSHLHRSGFRCLKYNGKENLRDMHILSSLSLFGARFPTLVKRMGMPKPHAYLFRILKLYYSYINDKRKKYPDLEVQSGTADNDSE